MQVFLGHGTDISIGSGPVRLGTAQLPRWKGFRECYVPSQIVAPIHVRLKEMCRDLFPSVIILSSMVHQHLPMHLAAVERRTKAQLENTDVEVAQNIDDREPLWSF
ncbi:hypothetical protein PMIN07_007162 [Paraphaeosphaeria minitans]